MSIVRAGTVTGTGVLAGAVIGLVPPWVIIELARHHARRVVGPYWATFSPHPLAIPYPSLMLTVVAVPATAMLLAALTTRATQSVPLNRAAG